MMQNVHLAPETDEDDLYSGYNDYNPTYDTEVKKKKKNKPLNILCLSLLTSWFMKTSGLNVLLYFALD